VANALIILGTLIGLPLTGLRLRRVEGRRGFGAYSVITALAAVGVLVAESLTWNLGYGALLERTLFVIILAWYVVGAWRLLRDGTAVAQSPRNLCR